ncbi:MAG: hypothetical protein H0U57_01730 [Tatlockia sp.]|nr:hypothetical protein [Tatlockia sp.]
MFYLEFSEDIPVKNIIIIGRIIRVFMSAQEEIDFAKRNSLTNIWSEKNGIVIETLLSAPINSENLKKFFGRFENNEFNKDFQQDVLEEFEEFTNTPSIEYLIHLIQDYIYFFDRKIIIKKKNLLTDAMPIYMDFITQAESFGMQWPETIEVSGTSLKTSKVLRALNYLRAHCESNLKPILTLLEDYHEHLIPSETLISELKRHLNSAAESPFPDFENTFPALDKELSENLLFSVKNLHKLYSEIANVSAHLLGSEELHFDDKPISKPIKNTSIYKPSGYEVELKTYIQNEFNFVERDKKLLSPLSLAKAFNFVVESPEPEKINSPQKFKRFSPQVNWKTGSFSPKLEKLDKVKVKLNFLDESVIPETKAEGKERSTLQFFKKSKSCFKPNQLRQIRALINQLDKEIKNGSFFYESRKSQKKLGLEQLITNSYKPGIDIVEAIAEVEEDFSEIRAGFFSNRTGQLLDSLLESAGVSTSCCC